MKKILLLILLSITVTSAQSQEEIDFKVGYLPNYNYTLTLKQISENRIDYKASAEILQNFKNNGLENPTITKDTSLLKSISTIIGLNANEFTINTELLESNNPTLVSGTKFYGKSIDGITKIDSIYSSTISEDKKSALLPVMESMVNQIKYPNKKIKVGESFEQNNPFSMPMGEVTIVIEINSIYTLKKIVNGIGYFSLAQVYNLKSATEDYEMKLDGTGSGQIEYDIQKQYFTSYFSEMAMNLTVDLEAFGVQLEMKGISEQTTEINANR